MFNNLANIFSDINFWGGVAEGAGKEFTRQEEDKRKDVRELRNFVISESSKLDDENRIKVESAGEAAEQIGSLIKGGRNVKSAAVKEATMFLIDEYGSATNALEAAKNLHTQYETYGEPFDPITTLGFTDSQIGDRVAPTYAQIGRKYTTIRPLPTLSSMQLNEINDKTALDKIFGGKGVAELAVEGAKPLIGPTITDQTQEAFETLAPEKPFYSEYVLSNNFDQELERMNAAQIALQSIPEAQRGPDFKSKERLIMDRISILKKTKLATDNGKELTSTVRRSMSQYFAGVLLKAAGYDMEYSPEGFWIPKNVKKGVTDKSVLYGSSSSDLLNKAVVEGLKGLNPETKEIDVDPYTFIEQGAAQIKQVVYVEERRDDDGVLITPAHLTYGGTAINKADNTVVTSRLDPALAASVLAKKLQDFKAAQTGPAKKSQANALYNVIKKQNPGKNNDFYDNLFKQKTGVDFSPYRP
jgi:hypothetical protein